MCAGWVLHPPAPFVRPERCPPEFPAIRYSPPARARPGRKEESHARPHPLLEGSAMTPRIERVVTSGTFSFDGGTWPVDNNVWLLGDDDQVLVIDAAHDAGAIEAATRQRRVSAIACTHGHNDHINVAPALADAVGAPVLLHNADLDLWHRIHPEETPDGE